MGSNELIHGRGNKTHQTSRKLCRQANSWSLQGPPGHTVLPEICESEDKLKGRQQPAAEN